MQIGKDCEPYLQSNEVIKILQNADAILHNKVFGCLRRFKKYFYSVIPLEHYLVPRDILEMCAEDAFSTTERIFYTNVKNNIFKPVTDYCTSYVQAIFKRTYLDLYQSEVRRKNIPADYVTNEDVSLIENEGAKRLFKKDSVSLKIEVIMNTLSEEDNKIYNMRYKDGLKRKEIAELLNIQPAAVTTKISRFHYRFSEVWRNQNKK